MKLENKVTVITGAGAGMGREITRLYAQEGARVIAADICEDGIASLIPEVAGYPGEVVFCKTDVSVRKQVEHMINLAVEKYGKLDVVINNAGIMDDMTPVSELEDSLWSKIMSVNMDGVMFSCRHAVRIMAGQESGGVIINTASVGGLNGCRAGAAYTASKFAVVGLTRNIGYMYARKGIRCNAICPGGVETNIGMGLRHPSEYGIGVIKDGLNLSPRLGKAEEVARVAVFLGSEDSSFINGTTITVDGGWTAF